MYDVSVIAMGTRATGFDDFKFEKTGKSFVLAVPKDFMGRAAERGIDTSFFAAQGAPSFYGHDSLAHLEETSGIRDLEAIIEAEMFEACVNFAKAIEAAGASNKPLPFNGKAYGVSHLIQTRTPDAEERPGMIIGLHGTTFLTNQAMGRVYKELRKRGEPLLKDENHADLPQAEGRNLGFMFNSLGLNASVVIGDQYVVGTRPNGLLHVPMNEGLRPADKEPKSGPDLSSWYQRGMEEELGIIDAPLSDVSIRELFMVQSVGQLGLHILVKRDEDVEEFKARQSLAVDRWENKKIFTVPYAPETLKTMAAEGEKTVVGYTRGLWHNLALSRCP